MKTCSNPDCRHPNPQPLSNFYDGKSRCKTCTRKRQRSYARKVRPYQYVNTKTLELGFPFPQCEHCYLATGDGSLCAVIVGTETLAECEVYQDYRHSHQHPLQDKPEIDDWWKHN